MKPRFRSLKNLMAAFLSVAVLSALSLTAEPAVQSNKTIPTKSIFIIPTNPNEGHDPFFPDSTRPYESLIPTAHTSDLATALTIKGISRMGNRYFAIIGNHTYGAGDEGDVKTSQGPIHIRCIEIKANSVVVEVDGQRHELTFSDNP